MKPAARQRNILDRLRDNSGGRINGLYDREAADEIESLREHLRLAIDHIAALNGALEDLASLGATIAICGTKYDDAAARKIIGL